MRARSFIALPLLGVAVVLACGPVAGPPPSPIPLNRCPAFPCAAYAHTAPVPSCNGDTCVSHGQFDPILVIDIPETSYHATARTLAIGYGDLVEDRYKAGDADPLTRPCQPPSCAVIPEISTLTGGYVIRPQVQDDVGYHFLPSENVALPSHVTYRPLWPPAPTGPYQDATVAGLPLGLSQAAVTAISFPGPGSSRGRGWRASLMPGIYERTIIPDPPFDAAFPPERKVVVVPGEPEDLTPREQVDLHTQLDELRTVRVVRDPPDLSLEGWNVFLRDPRTGQRMSELVTLHGDSPATFRLNTINFTDPLSSLEEVILPPADAVGVPSFVTNVPPTNFLSVDQPLEYPAIPPTVTVSGRIQGPNGDGVDAELLVEDLKDSSGGGSLVTTNVREQPYLHYSTYAATFDGGRYSLVLPPGTFDVLLVPAESSGLSEARVKVVVAGPPAPRIQAGRNLSVPPRTRVTGVALVDDGRPLAGVEVEAAPAAELAGQVDPSHWPRPQRTITDANGGFAMSVDQGTYDIVVRPPEGTRLPWTVSTSHGVGADAVHLDPIRVLAPILYDVTLHATDNSSIARAVVRAYAFPSRAGQSAPAAIEIGRTIAGADGRFQLFLTPPQ